LQAYAMREPYRWAFVLTQALTRTNSFMTSTKRARIRILLSRYLMVIRCQLLAVATSPQLVERCISSNRFSPTSRLLLKAKALSRQSLLCRKLSLEIGRAHV